MRSRKSKRERPRSREAADKIGMLFSKLENRPVERSARIAGA